MIKAVILALFFVAGAIVTGCAAPPAPSPTAAPVPVQPTAAPSPTEALPTEVLPTEIPLPTTTSTAPPETVTAVSTSTPRPAPSPRPIATPPGTLGAIGVMVDNDPHARPQTGLNAADVVYEVVAEFDLTRFLAIYFADAPTMVGSIRSTRPYFAMAMTEYGGGLVHCLDVPGVSNILTKGKTFNFDLCRSSGDEAAVRTTNRASPFNLFVNARRLADELNLHPARSAPALMRRKPLSTGGTSVTHLEIVHPVPHLTTWDWDGNVYLRQQDGRPHLEESGAQVSTDVIVIQQAQEQPTRFFGEGGYHIVALMGSGDGTVFSGGTSIPIRWSRDGVTSPTVMVDSQGGPFFLPPGRVFFEVVPPEAVITESG